MKLRRTLSIVLLFVFLANTISPVAPVKAQSTPLFDGTIAYIGTDGNVYLFGENGAKQQITFDATISNGSGYHENQIWYDCPYIMVENEKYISFMKRNTTGDETKNVVLDLSNNTVILEMPIEEDSCTYLSMDENGIYYQVDETDFTETGDAIQREYIQYVSGERKLVYEFSTKSSWGFNMILYRDLAVFQEKPYEITIYNLSTREYSHIGIPMEEILASEWSFDDRLILTSYSDNKIISVDLQTKQVSLWNFSVNNAVFFRKDLGYYLIGGNTGEGTPTALYKVDLNGQSGELIYMPSESVGIGHVVSNNGNLLSFLEVYSNNFIPSKLILLNQSNNPEVVSSSADFDYQWSSDFTKIYYIQLTPTNSDSELFYRELIIHNIRSGENVKILDLISNDMSGGRAVDEPISWHFNDSASQPVTPGTTPLITVSPTVTTTLTAISDLKATLNNPPITIGGITLDTNNVRLTWSFPTLNIDNIQYDLRYAEYPLNESNWDSATHVDNLPLSMKFGQTQETYVKIPEGKRIYFGIRIFDQNGNSSPISNIPSFFDTSFRPIDDGYRFCNKGTVANQTDCNRDWLRYPAQLTDNIIIQLFGKDVCRFKLGGKCIFDPVIGTWVFLNSNFDGGLCYGMSTSSLLLSTKIGLNNWNDPGDFQPGVNLVSEMNEQNGNNPIVYYQVTQNLYPVRDNLIKYESSARDFVDKLYNLFAQKDYPIMAMAGKTGHAILPYAIDDHSDGTYSIWVYDPNWPSLYDDHPEKRFLFVDIQNNTWQYELWEGNIWSNQDHNISLLSSTLYQQQPFPNPMTGLINIFPSINASIVAKNSAEQSVGYINDEFINQIPNAQAIPYFDVDTLDRDPSYELPLDTYSYFLSGKQGKPGGVAQLGTDYSIVFDNLVLNPQTQEQIMITPDGKQILFIGASPQKFKLITAFYELQQTLGINLDGIAVNAKQPLSIFTDVNKHSIVVSNISSNDVYSLTVERFTSTTYDKFVDVSLPTSQNDTHIIEYGTGGDVKVLIDHQSDGVIDETRVLQKTESQTKNPFSIIFDSPYLLVGGLGLLCLGTLAIGGVFIFTRSRKPKRAPSKTIKPQSPQMPVSSSAEQIKQAVQLAKLKRSQEAFEILRSLVQSEPNNANAWFNLGGVLIQMGNYKDSEHCFSRAKQLGHPKADDALNWLKQKRQ
jgi:hypothetical protein